MSEIKTFMDFCSGIGAGRLGLEMNDLSCVGHSEILSSSDATYRLFFGENDTNYSNLMEIDPETLPDFDMMIAGFPCQTFSIAGKREGFNDDRGNIIYGLIKILKAKEVKYFLFENVKGLVNHDKGRTFKIIQQELARAGYNIFYSVLDSSKFGVPQLRERIYIVGFRKELGVTDFSFPEEADETVCLKEILNPKPSQLFDETNETFKKYLANKYNKSEYTFEDLVKDDYRIIDTRHSDLSIYEESVPTLRTGRHGLLYALNGRLWRLSGTEALKLQGFREEQVTKYEGFPIVSNNTLLSQAGNAMTVNVIAAIAKKMKETVIEIDEIKTAI